VVFTELAINRYREEFIMNLIQKLASRAMYLEQARDMIYTSKDERRLYGVLFNLWLKSGEDPVLGDYIYTHMKTVNPDYPEAYWYWQFFNSKEFAKIISAAGRGFNIKSVIRHGRARVHFSVEGPEPIYLNQLRPTTNEWRSYLKHDPEARVHKFVLVAESYPKRWALDLWVDSDDYGISRDLWLPPIQIIDSKGSFESYQNMGPRLKHYLSVFRKTLW